MTVTVQWVTPDVDAMIARIARVSNPDNQGSQSIEGLLRYMMRNGHVSPFEMAHACLEIETTRDIGRQILRHRSFSFQEFSQRYQTAAVLPVAPPREARMQDKANRQSSLPCDDRDVQMGWLAQQERIQSQCRAAYEWALAHGIAKEQARALLPEGLTTTRMYMVGSFRSWVHYLQQRLHPSTQAEHREIAEQVRDVLEVYAPITMSAFFGRSGVVARGC